MGNQAQSLFGDQLARHPAQTIGLVFDAKQRILEVHDELLLARSQLGRFLTAHGVAAILHHFEGGCCVFRPVVVLVRQRALQLIKIGPCLLQLGVNQVFEFLEI